MKVHRRAIKTLSCKSRQCRPLVCEATLLEDVRKCNFNDSFKAASQSTFRGNLSPALVKDIRKAARQLVPEDVHVK